MLLSPPIIWAANCGGLITVAVPSMDGRQNVRSQRTKNISPRRVACVRFLFPFYPSRMKVLFGLTTLLFVSFVTAGTDTKVSPLPCDEENGLFCPHTWQSCQVNQCWPLFEPKVRRRILPLKCEDGGVAICKSWQTCKNGFCLPVIKHT